MKALGFRTRLLVILSLFALTPALAVTIAWGVVTSRALPLLSGSAAWERLAETGNSAMRAARRAPLDAAQRQALQAHEQELEESITQARRFSFLASRFVPILLVSAVVALGLLWIAASRVAGHLSRQMSRPLDELVGWTALIERGAALPDSTPLRGAPEFRVLRERMRAMSRELATGRERAIEAERLRAFRESAQRVAHELKNPLTPIQFAVARLKRVADPSLAEAVEVIETEARRLDAMARSFAMFGRLPEGTVSEVDVAELARSTARATVPAEVALSLALDDGLAMISGHHDALQRALSNVLLNAVDACAGSGSITVRAFATTLGTVPAVCLEVRDTGHGIAPEKLPDIWEPYVTTKAGGTGLGLAIARQTILAHHGAVDAESVLGTGTTIRFTLPTTLPPRGVT